MTRVYLPTLASGSSAGLASLGSDGLVGTPSMGGSQLTAGVDIEQFSVATYGALPGLPDCAARVQAAVAAAQASTNPGVKRVWFPVSDLPYNLESQTVTSDGAIQYCVGITADNIWIDFNGATIDCTLGGTNFSLFYFNGAGKNGQNMSYTNWITWNVQWAINPAAFGDQSVTMQTAAEAAQFTVGDKILIRAGQCFGPTASQNPTPDGDCNEVTSVNVGTGVIGLRWPLPKPFAVEYPLNAPVTVTGNVTSGAAVIPGMSATGSLLPNQRLTGTGIPYGTTIASVDSSSQITISKPATAGAGGAVTLMASAGQTSTVNNGNPAWQPTVSNITSKMITSVRAIGPATINAPNSIFWVNFHQCYEAHVNDLTGTYDACMVIHQFCRGGSQRKIHGQRVTNTVGFVPIAAGVATCTTDVTIDDIRSDGYETAIHVHEGAADITINNVTLHMLTSTDNTGQGLDFAGRCYGVKVSNVTIYGGDLNTGVRIDNTCAAGGQLTNVRVIRGQNALYSFQLLGSGWTFTNCDPTGGGTQIAAGNTWLDKTTILQANANGNLGAGQLPNALKNALNLAYAVQFPGVAGNYVTTPDAAANRITGNLEIRCGLAAGSLTRFGAAVALLGKYGAPGQISYTLQLSTAGIPSLFWSPDGTTLLSASAGGGGALPATLAIDTVLRAQLTVNNGGGGYTVAFATSSDGGATWSALGANTVTSAGTTSIFASNADLEIGANTGNSNPSFATQTFAEIANSLGGAAVAHWQSSGSSASYTAPSGETWTAMGTQLVYVAKLQTSLLTAADAATVAAAGPQPPVNRRSGYISLLSCLPYSIPISTLQIAATNWWYTPIFPTENIPIQDVRIKTTIAAATGTAVLSGALFGADPATMWPTGPSLWNPGTADLTLTAGDQLLLSNGGNFTLLKGVQYWLMLGWLGTATTKPTIDSHLGPHPLATASTTATPTQFSALVEGKGTQPTAPAPTTVNQAIYIAAKRQ